MDNGQIIVNHSNSVPTLEHLVDRFNTLRLNTLTVFYAVPPHISRWAKEQSAAQTLRVFDGSGSTVAELPQGYRDVPEEDRKKAKVFFDRGRTVSDTGNYDYAIEMFLQGLAIDPDSVEAHQTLREIAMKRKASGGKSLGMFEKMKLSRAGKDDRETMLKAEKILSYEPGNVDAMQTVIQSAYKAGFYDTVLWLGPIFQKANADSKSPDINKYIALRDIYVELKRWRLATDACSAALALRPDDMDLLKTMKNLGAVETMDQGGYGAGGSFRDSIRDMAGQKKLIEQDKDIRNVDFIGQQISDAEEALAANPEDQAKLTHLVECLVKSESMENENRAIELLDQWYQKTRQFRFRLSLGRIKMAQLRRQERAERTRLQKSPNDAALREQYMQFIREKNEEELKEFTLFAENYPTDMGMRYEMAVRLFNLNRFQDAIPIFQQARNDPKHRTDASVLLGRAFLEAGYPEESADTLKASLEEYELKGDTRSKELHYWYARALEKKGDSPAALKSYSQVAVWDFNYRDVQARIKKLRAPNGDQGQPAAVA